MITVPLIGEIKVGGLTTTQVEALVTQKLKAGEIIIDPNVTVNVTQVHSKKVYISGDGITHPGVYDLVVPTHVSELIALMGGFREFANQKNIRIIRMGPNGKVTQFKYNHKEVSHGKHLEQNILLQPGDQVYVD
jgi:polysaccharide export outer membrane protein